MQNVTCSMNARQMSLHQKNAENQSTGTLSLTVNKSNFSEFSSGVGEKNQKQLPIQSRSHRLQSTE